MVDALEQLKQAIEDFNKKLGQNIDETRQLQESIYSTSRSIFGQLSHGRYIRDDEQLILSSPSIIIGNVDPMGNPLGTGNIVEVRAGRVNLYGVGSGGEIIAKAPRIVTKAVDPGPDGRENRVAATSSISLQANSIGLNAASDPDCFLPQGIPGQGISIESDTNIRLHAAPSCDAKQERVKAASKGADESAKQHKQEAADTKATIIQCMQDLDDMIQQHKELLENEYDESVNQITISNMQEEFSFKKKTLYHLMAQYIRQMSDMAEQMRLKQGFDKEKDRLSKLSGKFKDDPNNTAITIMSEQIIMQNADADGNVKTHPQAGLAINAPHVRVSSYDNEQALIDSSDISLSTQHVQIDTIAPGQRDDKGAGELKLSDKGDVTITSKTILLQGIDQETKAEGEELKQSETAVAKDSRLSVLMEHIDMGATQTTDGKVMGDITLNAKDITLHAMDQDIDKNTGKRSDKEMAEATKLTLQAADIVLGNVKDEDKSQSITLKTDKLASTAKTSISVTQGEDKATLSIEGGKINEKADSTEIDAKTTIKQATELKDKLTGTEADFKTVKASSKLKGPKIDD